MIYNYKNLKVNLTIGDSACLAGYLPENEGIGFPLFNIESKEIIRMKKDGYHNIQRDINGKEIQFLSHTDIESYVSEESPYLYVNRDIIDSVNTDLFIVYLKWLLSFKKQKYIEVTYDNPYWLFHDICHIDDVQGNEVCCLSYNLEQFRLDQGLELMVELNYTPEFSFDEMQRIEISFFSTWKKSLDITNFKQFIKKDDIFYY